MYVTSTLLLSLNGLGMPAVAAEPMKPMAVVAFAGIDRFEASLAVMAQASSLASFPDAVHRLLQQKTQVASLQGLDPQRPWGAVLQTDGLLMVPLVFVPIQDSAAVLRSLAPWWGEAKQLPDQIYQVGEGTWTGFVKFDAGWMYVGQRREALARLPEPEKLVESLCPRFDGAVQLHFRNVPEVFGTMAIDHVRLALGDRLTRDESAPPATRALRRWQAELEYGLVEQALTESRSLTVGLSLRQQQAALDVELDPVADTRLAQWTGSFQKHKSRFAALHQKEASATLHLSMLLSKDEVAVAQRELETLERLLLDWMQETELIRTESELQLLNAWTDTLNAAIATGRIDLGLTLLGSRLPHTLLLAAGVGDAPLFEKVVERLTRLQPETLRRTKLEGPSTGPPLWQIEFGKQEQLSTLEQLLESPRRLLLAVGADAAWLGVGPQAEPTLRQMMPGEEVEVSPLDLTLRVGTLAASAGELLRQASPDWAAQASTLTAASATLRSGDETLVVTQESDAGKFRLRAIAGSGILRMITMGIALNMMR